MRGSRAVRFYVASDEDLEAIARLLLRAALTEAAAADLRRLLDELPRAPGRYEGAAHHFANVTAHLREEQGLVEHEEDLAVGLNEAVGSLWVLYRATGDALRALDPSRYTAEGLRAVFEEGELTDPGAGQAMLDATRVLHENLTAAGDRALLVEISSGPAR